MNITITITLQFHNIGFTMITSGVLLPQWPKAFSILFWIVGISDVQLLLIDTAEIGIWRIYAEIDGKQQENSFEVKEYGKWNSRLCLWLKDSASYSLLGEWQSHLSYWTPLFSYVLQSFLPWERSKMRYPTTFCNVKNSEWCHEAKLFHYFSWAHLFILILLTSS